MNEPEGLRDLELDALKEVANVGAGHAATALFSSKLYSQSERKLSTIQGFLDLLTTTTDSGEEN